MLTPNGVPGSSIKTYHLLLVRVGTVTFGCLAALIFIVFPCQKVSALLNVPPAKSESLASISLLFLVMATIVSFLLQRILRPCVGITSVLANLGNEAELNVYPPPPIKRTLFIKLSLQLCVSMALFYGTYPSMREPSSFATFLLVVFLVGLNLFCLRHCSPFISLLILFHLLVNRFFLENLTSSISHLSMTSFSMWVYLLTLEFVREERLDFARFIFPLALTTATLSHVYGALFCALTLLGLLVWFLIRSAPDQQKIITSRSRFVSVICLCLPVIGWVLLRHYFRLQGDGTVGLSSFGLWANFLHPYFGLDDVRLGRSLFVFLIILGLINAFSSAYRHEFSTVFVLVSFLFFLVIPQMLGVRKCEASSFLSFLIPMLYFIGNSIELIGRKCLRFGAIGAAIILLLGAPLASAHK